MRSLTVFLLSISLGACGDATLGDTQASNPAAGIDSAIDTYVVFAGLADPEAVAELRSALDDSVLATLRWDDAYSQGAVQIEGLKAPLSVQGVSIDDKAGLEDILGEMYSVHLYGPERRANLEDTDFADSDAGVDGNGDGPVGKGRTPQRRIDYVGKKTTTDFRGLGQHLQYFPALGLSGNQTDLRTDVKGTYETTPAFASLVHHPTTIQDFLDRTFTQDGDGLEWPRGVKTAGGFSN